MKFVYVLVSVTLCVLAVESAKPLTTRPIQLADLENHIANLDANDGFKQEFESLGKPTTQLKSWDYALVPENVPKHRYPPPEDDLLTYDETRVELKKLPGDQYSDFINANWIDNYQRKSTYIATQCPIDSTITDFYRMVWEQNVHELVMLASPHDVEKKKCAKYYPEDRAEHAGIIVNLERKEEFPDVVVRIYSLQKNDTVRVFVHHHFVSWPDLGVPEDPNQLLNLILRYRSSDTFTKAWPLTVHCSAGVGRTGTFLLTDAMFDMAKETGRVDFLSHLNHIRHQRISVVEKPEQYRLAHLVILEAYKQGLLDKNVDMNNNKQDWKSVQPQRGPQGQVTTGNNNDNNNRGGHYIQSGPGKIGNLWDNNRQGQQQNRPQIMAVVDDNNDELFIKISKQQLRPVACAA